MTDTLPLPRKRRLELLAERRFDLLIIGGGIVGAGTARDAARRGLSVALIEADDFAAGTSSRSSRLVHGGVRYLEHGYLHLVFEASRERRRLLQLSPHLVRPLQFTWPVYRGARVPRWKLAAGLTLYDTLALFRNVGRHERLNRAGILEREPALEAHELTGGATYWDAATDDARLTIANVIDAAAHGAIVLNHARVTSLTFVSPTGQANGAVIEDTLGRVALRVSARLVVNCTGPWTDEIAKFEDASAGPAVRGTKGVHIAVPSSRVQNRAAVTMLSPDDGRVMFTLPSTPGVTIIGTTDTATKEHPHEVRASRHDVRYLLSACNRFFPSARLDESDVISAWAGIRPLVAAGNRGDPSSASREHSIRLSPRGVLTVTGGKLTTYREMAEQIVDASLHPLRTIERPCDTGAAPLPGARPPRMTNDAPLVSGLPWTERDVTHAIDHEFAESIADVLVRRTTLAFETRDHGAAVAPRVAGLLASRRGWTDADVRQALDEYSRETLRIFDINA